jgi:hypothetical protein
MAQPTRVPFESQPCASLFRRVPVARHRVLSVALLVVDFRGFDVLEADREPKLAEVVANLRVLVTRGDLFVNPPVRRRGRSACAAPP